MKETSCRNRVLNVLWSHVYGEEIDKFDPHVEKLLKYFIRQFNLVLALNTEDFLEVKFTWAPFEDVLDDMYFASEEQGEFMDEADVAQDEKDEFDALMDEAEIGKGHFGENESGERSYYEKMYGVK